MTTYYTGQPMATCTPNSQVRLKLTDTGRRIWEKHQRETNAEAGMSPELSRDQVSALRKIQRIPEDWSIFYLWEVMRIFGPSFDLVGEAAFEEMKVVE